MSDGLACKFTLVDKPIKVPLYIYIYPLISVIALVFMALKSYIIIFNTTKYKKYGYINRAKNQIIWLFTTTLDYSQ